MKKYCIDYIDKCGDLSHVWVMANSTSDAEQQARSECWDIHQIIDIR